MPPDNIPFEGHGRLFDYLITLSSLWQQIILPALYAPYICIFFSLSLPLSWYFHMVKPNALFVIWYL